MKELENDITVDGNMLRAIDLILNTNRNVFICGKAGTGKSTFIKYLCSILPKKYVVLAPTGVSAINAGGVTVHSFFSFPLCPLVSDDEITIFRKSSNKRKLIEEVEVIIIDEVSMLRADLLDGIDKSLRINGGISGLPFGGKQMILVGDLFQLEPVVSVDDNTKLILSNFYDSFYFFKSKAFRSVYFEYLNFDKVYRQEDETFLGILNRIRIGMVEKEDIDMLNRRYNNNCLLGDYDVMLTTLRITAQKVNDKKLRELPGMMYDYEGLVKDIFEDSKLPTDKILLLKEGAQVMFIRNDKDKRWVNGTIGIVSRLEKDIIYVKVKNGEEYEVAKEVWENIEYKYNEETKKIDKLIKGTFTQFPLVLAWAITIHKSQGLTLDKALIYIERGVFAYGQLYVALSRCRRMDDIVLLKKITEEDIKIDKEILDFVRKEMEFNN